MEADRIEKKRDGERGMIVVLMAIAIVGLIGAGSLAIDIGSALVTKSELQNVADAASLASTRELAMIYKTQYAAYGGDWNYKEYTLTSADKARIQAKAVAFAAANKAGGLNIVVGTSDIKPAKVANDGTLTYSDKGARAIEVTGRRDDTNNGKVQTQLARVLGINQIAITADSAAAISAMGTLKTGKGEFPIGLDEDWFKTHDCSSPTIVKLYPTEPGACAAWHTFTNPSSSAIVLRTILDGIKAGTFSSPETVAGQTYYEFTGGTVASAVNSAEDLWKAKRDTGHNFRTTVPVYKSSGCANVSGPMLIVGFARINITNIKTAPDKLVEGDVECGIFDGDVGTGGGGSDFGTLIGTPGMVQ